MSCATMTSWPGRTASIAAWTRDRSATASSRAEPVAAQGRAGRRRLPASRRMPSGNRRELPHTGHSSSVPPVIPRSNVHPASKARVARRRPGSAAAPGSCQTRPRPARGRRGRHSRSRERFDHLDVVTRGNIRARARVPLPGRFPSRWRARAETILQPRGELCGKAPTRRFYQASCR